jgi:hypothetical protein
MFTLALSPPSIEQLEGSKEDAGSVPPAFGFIGNAHLITVRHAWLLCLLWC